MVSAPNSKENLEENGTSPRKSDSEVEIVGGSQLSTVSSSTTITMESPNLENGKPSDSEEMIEDRPLISLRNFSEIAEKSDAEEDDDDGIEIINEVQASSATRGLSKMSLDDGSTLLEMMVEEGIPDLASLFAKERQIKNVELTNQLLKMKKDVIERAKLHQNGTKPVHPSSAAPAVPLIRMSPSVSPAPVRFQGGAAVPGQVFMLRQPVPASRMGLAVRSRGIRPAGGVRRQAPPPPVQIQPVPPVSLVTTDASNNVVTVPLTDYKIVPTVQAPRRLIPTSYGILPQNLRFSSQPQSQMRYGNTQMIRLPSGIQVRQVTQQQPSPPPRLPPSVVTIQPTHSRAPPRPLLAPGPQPSPPRRYSTPIRGRSVPTPPPPPGPRVPVQKPKESIVITAGTQQPLPGTVQESDSLSATKKTFPSLVIHVKPCLQIKPAQSTLIKARRDLDSKVKEQLLLTPAKFTEHLMRRGLLKLEHNCASHPTSPMKLGMYSDGAKQPFSGGYVWTSDCCPQNQLSVFKGSFFEGSKLPPGTLLKLIYHWACQTPSENVLVWVKVPSLLVKNIYGLLRAAAIAWLHEKCLPLGGEGKYVEIGVVTIGAKGTTPSGERSNTIEILGAFDPLTRVVRLKIINVQFGGKGEVRSEAEQQGARVFQILWALVHWVDKRSVLLVDEIIDKNLFHELGFPNVVKTLKDTPKKFGDPSNANILNYLRHYVPRLFTNTLAVLTKPIIQEFLDELCWREQYGSTTLSTFENIISQLVEMMKWNADGCNFIERLGKVKANPFVDWSKTKQGRRSPLVTIPVTIRSTPGVRECIQFIMKERFNMPLPAAPAVPSVVPSLKRKVPQSQCPSPIIATPSLNPVEYQLKVEYFNLAKKELNLEQYYYGRLPPKQAKPWSLSKFTLLKCPLCPQVFSQSNRDIMRHFVEHVSALPKIGEKSVCSYCLKLPIRTLKEHLDDEHFFVRSSFVCWICRFRFLSQQELTIHMWSFHVEAEAPYSCEVCEFSSSIHTDVVDHFAEAHGDISYVLCPHCLQVFAAKSHANLGSIVAHLESHRLKRAKKCPKCVLSFGTGSDLNIHLSKCHSSKRDEKSWKQMASRRAPVFMAMPPVPPLITPPQAQPQSQKKRKLSNIQPVTDSVAIPITSLNAPLALPTFPVDKNAKFASSRFEIKAPNVEEGKALCFECGKDITTPNHFVGRLTCNKCRFVTACETAMNEHQEKKHGGKSTDLNFKSVELMEKPLVCRCGFVSYNPYELAEHLVSCRKYTLFPLPTQNEDERDADVDDHEATTQLVGEALEMEQEMVEDETNSAPTSN